MKRYSINECFYSPQGEGHRTGTMNVFLRFAGCNLQCVDKERVGRPLQGNEIDAGFNCDTDFAKGAKLSLEEVVSLVKDTRGGTACRWVILTGGEPALQVDQALVQALKVEGFALAIETNGTRLLDAIGIDWVSCSPKPGSHVVLSEVDEVRCVVKPGQAPDAHGLEAQHYFVSPACDAPTAANIAGFHGSVQDFNREAMAWAVDWCRSHPDWRISLQIHKLLGVR